MSQLLEHLLADGSLRLDGVVHLGAEWCQEAPLYDAAGARFVLWAEASPENTPERSRETAQNLRGRPHHKFVHRAVWSASGESLPFNIYNARSSNSLFGNGSMAVWYPQHAPIATVQVETVTADDLMREHWPEGVSPTLLAMDLQGAELHALRGASSLLSDPGLTYVVTEAMTEPLYAGGCLLAELEEFLEPFGFTKTRQERHEVGLWYRETVGKQIERGELPDVPQFDVLFVREGPPRVP